MHMSVCTPEEAYLCQKSEQIPLWFHDVVHHHLCGNCKTSPCSAKFSHYFLVVCSLMCSTGTAMGHMTTSEDSPPLWRKCCVLHNKRCSKFDFAW